MKRKSVILVLGLVVAGVGVALWPKNSSKQVLPGGTVLVLSGLEIGRATAYTHGTSLAKMLGGFVPSNGVSVGRFKLQRARTVRGPSAEGPSLMAELSLLPGSDPKASLLISQTFYRKYRLLITGDDDYAFVNDFPSLSSGTLPAFKRYDDGFFAQIWAHSFPRDSRLLHFRLEERDRTDNRDWRELATFVLKNPKPARIEPWKAQRAPHFKLPEGLDVEVGELTVRHKPFHPTDIWEYTAELPIRITRNGQAVTNWGILEGKVRDASGNFDAVPAIKVTTNDWIVYRIFRPLDPTKLQRFQLRFGRDADFPATNLFSFTVPWPMPNVAETNFGGVPCQINFVNSDMLHVELTNKPVNLRVTFVSATDDDGNDLDNWGGSWGQHYFWKSLKLTKPTQVHAIVAIRPEYEAEFTLQPRYEKASQ